MRNPSWTWTIQCASSFLGSSASTSNFAKLHFLDPHSTIIVETTINYFQPLFLLLNLTAIIISSNIIMCAIVFWLFFFFYCTIYFQFQSKPPCWSLSKINFVQSENWFLHFGCLIWDPVGILYFLTQKSIIEDMDYVQHWIQINLIIPTHLSKEVLGSEDKGTQRNKEM